MIERELESLLWVRCFQLHIERIIDNLLNKAYNVIPEKGENFLFDPIIRLPGAVVEINNKGQISEEEKRSIYF